MFYTLTTKFLINKKGNEMEYMYIYIIGSVCYVMLHHCMHLYDCQNNIVLEKLANYFYYLVVADIIIAFMLYKATPVAPIVNDKENNNEQQQLTLEQRELMMRKMQEARRYQLMRMRELEKHDETDINDRCQNIKNDNNKQEKKVDQNIEKKSIFSKSDNSTDASDEKKNKDKPNTLVDDTEIPIFNNKS